MWRICTQSARFFFTVERWFLSKKSLTENKAVCFPETFLLDVFKSEFFRGMKKQVGKNTDTLESLQELGIKVVKCCNYSWMITQLLVHD